MLPSKTNIYNINPDKLEELIESCNTFVFFCLFVCLFFVDRSEVDYMIVQTKQNKLNLDVIIRC